MRKRQLRTARQAMQDEAARAATPKQRRAFLVAAYPASTAQGNPQLALVTFSDPIRGTRGTTMRARVRAGLSTAAAIPVGSPVLVQLDHGKAEIMSFG